MDKRLFTIEVGYGGFYAEIDLPATDYEMLDLLDKLRASPGADMQWDICSSDCAVEIENATGSIYELNALARQLAGFSEDGWTVFCGLVDMEEPKNRESVSVRRLIDLAHGTDCCHVAQGVNNDYELGKFYVNNGFFPKYDHLPDSVYDDLDYAKIGREMRKSEGGVFTADGYVTKHTEPEEVHKKMDFTPRKPDYAALIEVGMMDSGETVMLGLPTTEYMGNKALKDIGADNWDEVNIRCADCRIPQLRDVITQEGTILAANTAADELSVLSDTEVTRFKMLLEARGFTTLDDALEALRDMHEYVFSPQLAEPSDVAMDTLRNTFTPDDAELIAKHTNLDAYGQELIERDNIAMTAYGAVERLDGQPVQAMEEQTDGLSFEMTM